MVELREPTYEESLLRQLYFFRNLESTQSVHRFIFPFSTFVVYLTFGKILNIWEGKSHSK